MAAARVRSALAADGAGEIVMETLTVQAIDRRQMRLAATRKPVSPSTSTSARNWSWVWLQLAATLLLTAQGCRDAKSVLEEFRQAGRLVTHASDPAATAAPSQPEHLVLPTCAGLACGEACDQHGLEILLVRQPLEITSKDTECLVCIVNANVACDGRNSQPSTPLDEVVTTRALDLLTLPPPGLGDRIPELRTQPIGLLN